MSAPLPDRFWPRTRLQVGAALYELPRALWGLRPAPFTRHPAWVWVRNRRERLVAAPHAAGVRCDWRWTSELHVARVFPRVGVWLLRRALRAFPVELADEPPVLVDVPRVSFIIGHRGVGRLPHLRATLATLAAQRGVRFECLLVEQSPRPEVRPHVPSWVRYFHTPLPHPDMPYNRAWAFNVGAARARGALLVLHDNDLLVPCGYAAALWERFAAGAEVINLKRFIFYLTASATWRVWDDRRVPEDATVESVLQNAEAGGSLGVSAAAYRELGGCDESFVGWGGEDNEFWERAATRVVDPFGYLPLLHQWHEPQPGKVQAAAAWAHFDACSRRPPAERIAELCARGAGRVDGPRPAYMAPPSSPDSADAAGASPDAAVPYEPPRR